MGSWGYAVVDGDGPLVYIDGDLIYQFTKLSFGCAERLAIWEEGSDEQKIHFVTCLYVFLLRELQHLKEPQMIRDWPQTTRVKAILALLWKEVVPYYALWRECAIDALHQIKLEYANECQDPELFVKSCQEDIDAIADDDPSRFLAMRAFSDLMNVSRPMFDLIKRFEDEIGFQAVDLDSVE